MDDKIHTLKKLQNLSTLVVKGNRSQAEQAAKERGIKTIFVHEIEDSTVLITYASKKKIAAWLVDDYNHPVGRLLSYTPWSY